MKTVVIIQARVSSTRLPGKVLLPLGGESVIGQVFHQLSYCKNISSTILATSVDPTDDRLAEWAEKNLIRVERGSLDDVLDRFYQCAVKVQAETIVRVTGDCPLIDPSIVDKVISFYYSGKYDYVSNTDPPSFPDGMDTEVFSMDALTRAWKESKLRSEREHVTPFIRNKKNGFRIGNYSHSENLETLRLTLDNPEDYSLISIIYEMLSQQGTYISMDSIIALLKNEKSLIEINKKIQRNEGYIASLKKDKERK